MRNPSPPLLLVALLVQPAFCSDAQVAEQINVANMSNSYQAVLTWVNNPNLPLQVLCQTEGGIVHVATPTGSVTGWPDYLNSADRDNAVKIMIQNIILVVITPSFLTQSESAFEADYLAVTINFNRVCGGNTLGGIHVTYLELARKPEAYRDLTFREAISRYLFKLGLADAKSLVYSGPLMQYSPVDSVRKEPSKPFQLAEIEELLSLQVPDNVILTHLESVGLASPLSQSDLQVIRQRGASQSVIEELVQAGQRRLAEERAADLKSDAQLWMSLDGPHAGVDSLRRYLARYPEGTFVDIARQRLSDVEAAAARAKLPPIVCVIKMDDFGRKVGINFDGRKIAALTNGRRLCFQVSAGDHYFVYEKHAQVTFEAGNGRTYYFAQVKAGGSKAIVSLPDERGEVAHRGSACVGAKEILDKKLIVREPTALGVSGKTR